MQTDEATLRKTVAKNIAQYRKAHHDTQLDLATKLNYSDKSVSKWERGESLPDVYILSQIAELYGVSVSALIGEIQPPKESKPHYHMFILLLSLALTMAVATLLFSMFMICKVDYPAWMFFVYALPVCSIICIVFTSFNACDFLIASIDAVFLNRWTTSDSYAIVVNFSVTNC